MDRRIIAAVGIVGLVALIVWSMWPKPQTPEGTPPPSWSVTPSETVVPTTTAQTSSAAPTSTLKPSPSASATSASPTSVPTAQKFKVTYLPEGAQRTEDADSMVATARAYLVALNDIDSSKPWPGWDFEALLSLSGGERLTAHTTEAEVWRRGPSGADKVEYEKWRKNGYKQVVTVEEAWVTESHYKVVVTISLTDTSGAKVADQNWMLEMGSCETSGTGWCVNTATDEIPD